MSHGSTRIAIFGPGLMGASLLMALRARKPDTGLSVWARRQEAVDEVLKRSLSDSGSTDVAEVARSADIIVLCVPVDRMKETAALVAPHLKPDALVTDVGSTKEKLVSDLEKIFSGNRNFVGSHPMCGSEESGMGAARPDLYEGALCAVCPTSESRPDLVQQARDFWKSVGGRVKELSPTEHDAAVAAASHVPHVVAAALVELVAQEQPSRRQLCATGFRDTTRIASGSPELWTAILSDNAEKTASSLARLEAIIAGYRQAIADGRRKDIAQMLRSAAEARAKIFPNN